MKTAAYFIQHCDSYDCNLGRFQYICPYCDEVVDDYDIWYLQDEILNKKEIDFNCECCKRDLTVFWGGCEYFVY